MKLSFIGDMMPARFVRRKYSKSPYQIASKDISKRLKNAKLVVANLESPVSESAESDGHHLSFKAHPDILKEFKFVDIFSIANNHINDCGSSGMDETVKFLNKYKFSWNGLYKNQNSPHN